ncbi:Trypsin [Dissostichus eleginoides]|uniref:Trypsin n=1 Tax=Dissostichus eleginoides TaxID=100907 RepID=A0AAD9FDF5_DISEL|nr:Trypsin [Dissostichus eleginoides]
MCILPQCNSQSLLGFYGSSEICGLSADGSRIIKGAIAPDDTYKFLVSLQKNEKHMCGGFLISEDFVLTAAHCSAEEPDRVVVGTHDLSKVGEENVRYIEKRYKHRSYYQVDKADGSRIIKGAIAPDDTYKFLVSLQKNEKHMCGGFLISEDFVLTAAHCSAEEPDRVVVGTHDLSKVGEENVRYIEKRYKHRSYYQVDKVLGSKIINGTTAGDDLMKYMVSVQEDDEHICGGFLVSKQFVVTHGGCKFDKDGKVFAVLGTHHLSKPGNKIKEDIKSTCKPPSGIGTDIMLIELRVVDVTVISPKACKVQIPELAANAICTGGKLTTDKGGFCKRDAGGPLVCKGKAVGIATVNDNCSFTGLPNGLMVLILLEEEMLPLNLDRTWPRCKSEDATTVGGPWEPDRVVVGTHDLSKVGEENVRYIEKRYKHRSYYQVDKGNDIMLLKLTRKVAGNKKQIIALPPSNMHIQEMKTCHVAGWGFTKTGGGVVDRLMVVDVSVINLNTCSKLWGGIPSDVICAGGYGSHKGFCQRDAGGPLVCKGKAVGIATVNDNCSFTGLPNVYINISIPFLDQPLY